VAIEELISALEGAEGGVRERILDAFESANQKVLAFGTGAATTLSVVEIEVAPEGVHCRPYHAGDSSILVCGGRGRVKVSTVSHSPVGYAVEAGLLGPEEALHHVELNVVSNLVGMSDMRIDLGPRFLLSPLDTIAVGTDGLFDNLQAEEIVAAMRKGPIDRVRERLAALASERMQSPQGDTPSKPDDMAFLIYRPPRSAKR
jgi:serine/threonine protein phosphatase PrpC